MTLRRRRLYISLAQFLLLIAGPLEAQEQSGATDVTPGMVIPTGTSAGDALRHVYGLWEGTLDLAGAGGGIYDLCRPMRLVFGIVNGSLRYYSAIIADGREFSRADAGDPRLAIEGDFARKLPEDIDLEQPASITLRFSDRAGNNLLKLRIDGRRTVEFWFGLASSEPDGCRGTLDLTQIGPRLDPAAGPPDYPWYPWSYVEEDLGSVISEARKKAAVRARIDAERRRSARPPPSIPKYGRAPPTAYRYPTLEAPDQVAVGQRFAAQFWLTKDLITPGVQVKAGDAASLTPEGRLAMRLPATQPSWRLRVVLTAPGFDLVEGDNTQEIMFEPQEDSTPALFVLKALVGGELPRKEKLRVTLWHNGVHIATIARDIAVIEDAVVSDTSSACRQSVTHRFYSERHTERGSVIFCIVKAKAFVSSTVPASTTTQRDKATIHAYAYTRVQPDLTVHIQYDDPARLGDGQIILASPHFEPPSRLVVERFTTPPNAKDWLDARYGEMMALTEEISSITGDDARSRDDAMKARGTPLMAGLGRELYRRFAPFPFQKALTQLVGEADKLDSIQIFTNNPFLPWELMRPDGPGGWPANYLAISYRVARWHVGDDRRIVDHLPQQLVVRELAMVAPRYSGARSLPSQIDEIAALKRFPGFRPVEGRLDALRRLMAEPPAGIVHFVGHGVVQTAPGKAPTYMIGLEDAELDLTSWRGLSEGRKQHHPLFFFNACELGRADSIANFVDGWAPAVLESGASGYIGGLWPLFDRAAADFSRTFYAYLMSRHGAVPVADALSAARRRFHETGDPTFLAYAFYGDVNLLVVLNR